jgi:hypothetical protein
MTIIQITLPDQLAQEAQQAGLLSPQLLEKWLRDEPAIMSPEEVAEEIAAMRAERSASNPS